MWGRYLGLLWKDIIVAYRNYFFHVIIGVAILFALIINFVIPESATIKPAVYYSIDYEGDIEKTFKKSIDGSKREHKNITEVNSRDKIVQKMKEKSNSIGMYVTTEKNTPTVEFILQGHENEKVVNSLILAMKDDINGALNNKIDIQTIVLRENLNKKDIPLNKRVLPIFIVMESAMIGFVLIAVLIFMEKEENIIVSYVVSPGKIPEYLASKITLMIILGFISCIISSLLVVGNKPDYLLLLSLVAVGSIFSSSVSLIISSFFKNISQAFIWIAIVNITLGLPLISYFLPSFAPIYIKILPTYPLIFGMQEAVFSTGNTEIITNTIILFVELSVITYLLSIIAYRRYLVRN